MGKDVRCCRLLSLFRPIRSSGDPRYSPCRDDDAEIKINCDQLDALLEPSKTGALMTLIADQMHDIVPRRRLSFERYATVRDVYGVAKWLAIDD